MLPSLTCRAGLSVLMSYLRQSSAHFTQTSGRSASPSTPSTGLQPGTCTPRRPACGSFLATADVDIHNPSGRLADVYNYILKAKMHMGRSELTLLVHDPHSGRETRASVRYV